MWILKMDPSTSVRGLTAVFLASLSVLIFSAESLVLGSVVVSEDFNSYANNAAVNGLNGGSGWSAPWNSNSGIIANPSGNGSLVRGSFHSSNRSFTSMGTSGVHIFTWTETTGGLPNSARRVYFRDSASASVAQIEGSTFTSNGGTTELLTATAEIARFAMTLNYATGLGSFTGLGSNGSGDLSGMKFDATTGLLTENTGTPATNIINFSFNPSIAVVNFAFSDSTNRGVDDIAFGTGLSAATALGFTITGAGGGEVPEPSTAAIAILLIGGGAIRRLRRSRLSIGRP
jgi:hypothetical protein